MHYELSGGQERVLVPLEQFSHMKIDTSGDSTMPVLYVTMATWIPKCNLYHQQIDCSSSDDAEDLTHHEQSQGCDNPKVTGENDMPYEPSQQNQTAENRSHEDEFKDSEVLHSETHLQGEMIDCDNSKVETTNTEGVIEPQLAEATCDVSISSDVSKEIDISISTSVEITSVSGEDSTPSRKRMDVKNATEITPTKALSPKHFQKKLLSDQKRQQKQTEREEREKKRQEEKLRLKEQKLKEKQEKEEQKRKEKEEKEEQKRKEKEEKEELRKKEKEQKEEQKKKEREEKEQKRKEREEKEEQKRRERETEKLKRQQEAEDKIREKQRIEEKKQKEAAAFVSFFVPIKTEQTNENKESFVANFKPFEVKSDMKLAPINRNYISPEMKEQLIKHIEKQACQENYIQNIKNKKNIRKSRKTWPFEETNDDGDVVVVEEADVGETISEGHPQTMKCRAKLLQFHDNRRPAYYGTWRKRSLVIRPRNPLGKESEILNYEYDSDDDWEEEEQGESIVASDGEEEKDPEAEADYEIDDFFVPHGYLSDDEVDEEENQRLSPTAHKAKLKLLKNEFDEEMKSKTQRLKPRVIGCHWHKKDGIVDEIIDRYLRPLAMLHNGPVIIPNRKKLPPSAFNKKTLPKLDEKTVKDFLTFVHGNKENKKNVVNNFVARVMSLDPSLDISHKALHLKIKKCAEWKQIGTEVQEDFCWQVKDEIRDKYKI